MKWIVFRFLLSITWPSVQALFTVKIDKAKHDAVLGGEVQMRCQFSPLPLAEPMKWIVFRFLLSITWPSVQALFTVKIDKAKHDAVLGGEVQMRCQFSPLQSTAELLVIWQRTAPGPSVEVYRLDRGLHNNSYTSQLFQGRASLVAEELQNSQAVLKLSHLQISDSGTYRCIIRHQEVDYKETQLTVYAPYTPMKKSLRRIGNEQVELSCQLQGFPLTSVVWSDSKQAVPNLMERSNSTSETTINATLNITSWVTVPIDVVSNYTCSVQSQSGERLEANFYIPDDITDKPMKCTRCHSLAAVSVIALVLTVAFISLVMHKRRKAQKRSRSLTEYTSTNTYLTVTSTDFLLPQTKTNTNKKPDSLTFSSEVFKDKTEELREVLLRRYVTLSTDSETKSGFFLPHQDLMRENQCVDIRSILPEAGETVLLEVSEGPDKTSVAKRLASSWAGGVDPDPLDVRRLRLVVLVDFRGAEGDLFEMVLSELPTEAGLESGDIKEILLHASDILLILDSYKQGHREADQSLIDFLTGCHACRVLITACPGDHSSLGDTVRKVLRLRARPTHT